MFQHGIDGKSVVGGIQNRFSQLPLRVPVTKFAVPANPRHRVMLVGTEQSRIDRQIVRTIRRAEHIQRSAVEISFTVTVPAPVGIGIGELAFAAALPVAGLTAVTKELSEGTGSCLHWGAVADDAKGTGAAE